MAKYRFKTEEEFIRDGLWLDNLSLPEKGFPKGWNSAGGMNKYLGKDVSFHNEKHCDGGFTFSEDTWSFTSKDYVLKETNPTTQPFKWVVECTLENKKHIEDFFKNKASEYEGYTPAWKIEVNLYYFYPQVEKNAWARNLVDFTREPYKNYTLITTEKFYEIAGVNHAKIEDIKSTVSGFKKGDYIVCLIQETDSDFKPDYCYRQRENYPYLRPELTISGSITNGWGKIHVDKPENWRYATAREIDMYNEIQKPYDVTKTAKGFVKGDYIVLLHRTSLGSFKTNHCYKQRENCSYLLSVLDSNGATFNGWATIKATDSYKWRFATPQESMEYERRGQPFDVTLLKEQNKIEPMDTTEYFTDLSNHIGRYIKALEDTPFGGNVKKGDYGIITSNWTADFPNHKAYACETALKKGLLNVDFELMPEGFVPPFENVRENVKEDYTGRYIKAKKREIQAIRLHPDEIVRIKKKDFKSYCLDKCGEANCSGFSIAYPLKLDDWELLPEGYKPDLKGDEYQPGNCVYLLEDYGSLKAGEIYPFVAYQSSHCITVDHSNHPICPGKHLSPYIKNCRKATPEEIKASLSKYPISPEEAFKIDFPFKKGDKVKLIANCSFAGVLPGETGIVTAVHAPTFSVNYCSGCGPEYWEKVESEKEPLISKEDVILTLYKPKNKPNTSIEDVHSVGVNLCTKNKSKQFKI